MKPTIRASAIMLAAALLAGGSVRAENHVEFTNFGENCISLVTNHRPVIDGEIAVGHCMDFATRIAIAVRCNMDNTTVLSVSVNKHMLEDGLRLWTELDGVETPEWDWDMSTDNEALYIRPAIPTIKEVLKHSRLRVRIIEGNGDIHNADIDISHFGEAIAPVRALCQW